MTTSPQASVISVEIWKTMLLISVQTNYLGLSNDPELIEAAKATLDSHGFGLSSVRFYLWYAGYSQAVGRENRQISWNGGYNPLS